MARIPDVDDFGPRPIAQARAPRVVDRSGEILADAAGRFADKFVQVASRIEDREDNFAYGQARNALITADVETRRQLENDSDWSTYDKRYSEAMEKAREKAGSLIRSKHDRALFDSDSRLSIERNRGEVLAFAKQKEGEWGRAATGTDLEANRTAYLNAKDEATRAELHQAAQALIAGAVQKGYIKADAGAELGRQHVTSLAEGFIDMQPYDRQVEILKNPTGTPVEHLAPDRRVDLLRRAEDQQRILLARQEAERKQAQAEARQALSERVRDARVAYRLGLGFDAPPSRRDFVAAYGAEDGAKAFSSFEKDRQLGADLTRLATMSEADQAKLLQESAPKGTDGAAEQAERYQALASQVEQVRKQRDADPATFVTRHSPRVQEAWAAAQESPEAARAYATASIAEQQRLGVRQPRILPVETASEIAQSFHTQKGEQVAALIQTEREKWGQHWPQVFGELAAKKIPPAALAIGRGMSPGAATRLASVAAIPMDELKKGVGAPAADVTDSIETRMVDFRKSLDGVVGGDNTFANMYEAVERLAYSYMRAGKAQETATEQAYNEVLGDHYAFRSVNGREFRVPVEHDVPGIEIGATRALNTVRMDELQQVVPTGRSDALEQVFDRYPVLEKFGFQFKDSPPDQRGRKLEFYPPGESHSTFKDKSRPGIERFDPSMGTPDIFGEMLHYAPRVDKKIGDLREKFQRSISAEQQEKWLRGDYDSQVRAGLFGDKRPTFDEWLNRQGGDAFFRGYLTQQYPAEAYTKDQKALFGDLDRYLSSGASSRNQAAQGDLKRAIQRRGYWVTSANGESGLALFLDGSPVLRKDGSVYELSWDDLTRDIAKTRSEIQQGEDDRLFQEAAGLR